MERHSTWNKIQELVSRNSNRYSYWIELKSVFLVKSEMKIEQNYQDILTSIKNIS